MANSFKSQKEFLEYILSGKKFYDFTDERELFFSFRDDKIHIGDSTVALYSLEISRYADFKPYIEPAKRKKYWLWNIKYDSGWRRADHFLDDDGKRTNGQEHYSWDTYEKQKIEDQYIEVEE